MSTITSSSSSTSTSTPAGSLWRGAVGFGALAAVATTAVAAAADAVGISLDVSGEPIPLSGFAVLTFLFSLVGLAVAAGIRRWSATPRRTWTVTASVLTLASFVPDLLADAAVGTRLTLMTTHLVAALIVVPAVAARLAARRV